MVSHIDPTANGFNQLFPVAGVNNSTQGYRNNFTSIFNNFTFAKSEIETIQNKQLVFTSDSQITYAADVTSNSIIGDSSTGNISLKLKIADNLAFPGTSALTVVKGTTSQRPNATNGFMRYNTTTNSLEIGINGTWANLSTTVGESTFALRGGDTFTGNVTMAAPTGVAQIFADAAVPSTPGYSFRGDNTTGINRPAASSVGLVLANHQSLVIGKNNNNYVANFSPSVTPATNSSDTSNTKIHGQFRGYQKTFEYFLHRSNLQNNTVSQDWHDLMAFDASGNAPMTVGINCEFMVSGMGTQSNRAFCVAGHTIGSFIVDFSGSMLTPVTPTTYTNITSAGVDNLSVDFKFERVMNLIHLRFRCVNTVSSSSSLDFDFSGKVTVNFGGLGIYPISVFHD